MTQQSFLIDANSFIEPYRKYYSFDFTTAFWDQMGQNIKDGNIVILDIVRDEIMRGDDDLTNWIKALPIGKLVDHREGQILANYGRVLQHIQSSPYFKESALTEWAKESVADPWLIAAAKACNCQIVTFEVANTNPDPKQPWKAAKIPTVAKEFGVTTLDLFSMMRSLHFRL